MKASQTVQIITDSCQTDTYWAHLPIDMRVGWNEELNTGCIGVSWSRVGADYATLWYVPRGRDVTEAVPLVDYESGKIHYINARRIVNDDAHQTTARNIVIHF